ncbi:hypothetical protein AcV7_000039 [Taiwanofungus camphoratus]|nr:hypothetical protein AcV7_000039 [Antrodia cinnamomea]
MKIPLEIAFKTTAHVRYDVGALAEFKIMISTLVRHFVFEEDGNAYVFYKSGGNTIKPLVRGREHEGPQMHLRVRKFRSE